MKIFAVTNNIPGPFFGSRKTLYTDFDGTYFPFKKDDIKKENSPLFSKMYLPFDTFKKSSDDFSIVVTTGRTRNDFFLTQDMIQDAGLDFCTPDALITANGANSYILRKKDGKTEAVDINDFKDYSNSKNIVDDINRIIKEFDSGISVIECKINGEKEKYGDYSTECVLEKLPPEKRRKYASIARDGRFNMEIIFSDNVNDDVIAGKVREFVSENSLPYSVEHYKNSPFTKAVQYVGNQTVYTGANNIIIKYKQEDKTPDKQDIIKNKLSQIIKSGSGDKIIAAGDGFNDESMLNPLNYLEIAGIDNKGRREDELLEDTDVISALKSLPFEAIICGKDKDLDSLRKLAKKLDKKGVHIIHLAPNTIEDYSKIVEKLI